MEYHFFFREVTCDTFFHTHTYTHTQINAMHKMLLLCFGKKSITRTNVVAALMIRLPHLTLVRPNTFGLFYLRTTCIWCDFIHMNDFHFMCCHAMKPKIMHTFRFEMDVSVPDDRFCAMMTNMAINEMVFTLTNIILYLAAIQ